jgi:hypothetical protein
MSRLNINIGTTANDRTGDPLRTAFEKVNANFIELYAVQLPAQATHSGKFLTTDGTTLSWGTVSSGNIAISNFGEGFSLTDDDKIVTNKLYSNDITQPTQRYRLELTTTGVVVLPDQSIINGATLKTVAGNYAGITAGPAGSTDEDSWVWVDNDGATISTKTSTDNHQWKFDNVGTLTLPAGGDIVDSSGNSVLGGGLGNLGDLEITGATIGTVDDSIAIKISVIDSSSTVSQWQFGTTGILSLPAGGIVWNNSESPPTPIGGWLASSSLSFDKDVGAKISNGVGGVGSVEWTFGKNGNLTLPIGGDVVDSTGTSVLGTPTVLDGGNASTTF